MEATRRQDSYLLRQFREFYREVARLKRMVEYSAPLPLAEEVAIGAAASAAGSSAETAALGVTPQVDSGPMNGVWQQLLSILERQAIEAGQSGGAFAFEVYREAQYVMAALADEVFLHVEWEGRSTWPLLENRLFQSHIAGEAVFDRLDRLLQRRDFFYLDLAAVYFMALSLGFQGKYRGEATAGRLDQYRRQLFMMIYRRNPKLFAAHAPLFPQNYQNMLERVSPKKLPDDRIWLLLVAAVIGVWLLVSQYLWHSVTDDISCLICRITNANCLCEVGPSK
jgi:type VI secretion system protein ImpK